MKKLMIAAAIVCAAAFANAATCNWTAMMGAQSSSGAATGTYTAYLVQTSVSADTAVKALYAGTFSDYLASTGTLAQGPTMFMITGSNLTMNGTWNKNDTINAYTLVVDTSKMASDDTLYYLTTAAAPTATVTDALLATFSFNSIAGNTWNTYSEDVPEPTSGLLLLLGVAGLALRRRRA